MRSLRGTEPQVRESHDCERLSPIMKYEFGATRHVFPKCWLSASRRAFVRYGSFSFSKPAEPGFLTRMLPCLSSCTISFGSPITRFTNVPPSPQSVLAVAGVLKTTMSPRDGPPKRRQMRHASTRSLESPRHPGPGFAQFNAGSVEDEGIRYGLTTKTLRRTTMAT